MNIRCKVSHKILYGFILGILLITFSASAQQADSGNTGIIKGKVKDSTYNFIMNSATIAIYDAVDSALLKFTMPNGFGEFMLQPLPTDKRLKLVITHVGYKPFTKFLRVSKEKPEYDLGWIYMFQNDSGEALNDVIVTTMAPVRMNGDTVEFKADAFRLDSNATAEDLLRKLPGFTVWGDGDITYNGKKINQLLVDGKPFLGGTDFTAATQNLPKEVLDKVQVYQQRDEKNPLDSTMFANLKLKEDKSFGHFGKVSAGYGSDKHYVTDGMLTGFNKKMQLSAVAGANDINKLAGNTDALIKNSSYKGVGASTDYQPDFTMNGINKPVMGGMKFQYDFKSEPQYQKQRRLNADYFFSRNNANVLTSSTTNQFLSKDSILSTVSNSNSKNISANHHLNTTYLLQTPQSNLTVNSFFSSTLNKSSSANSSQQIKTGEIASTNKSYNNNRDIADNLNSSIEYTHTQRWIGGQRSVPSDFTVKYSFSFSDNTGNGRTLSDFHSAIDPSADKTYDRLYDRRNSNAFGQSFYARYPDLTNLIFGRARLVGIQMSIDNTLNLMHTKGTTQVLDLDSTTKMYKLNDYLTNDRELHIMDENPSLTISKSFARALTNRYSKDFSVSVNLKEQYYRFEHTAIQKIQDVSYDYRKFIPNLSLSYFNHQYGEFEIHSSLNYEAKVNYPTIELLAPLIDSTNLQNVAMPNVGLKPENEKDLSFEFRINSRMPKNPWEISLNAAYRHLTDVIADSILYNEIGQQVIYRVNLHDAENTVGGIGFRKSFEAKANTYRITFNYNYSIFKSPDYTNSILNLSKSSSNALSSSQDYSHLDIITLQTEEGLTYYKSVQQGFSDSRFDNHNIYTRFSGALQLPKNVVWSSNITFNRSGSDNSRPDNYTIWNASLTYRFLHGNRGEIKFSALDLLHQNKGVINITKGAMQEMGYNNVLQQYFMLTFAYYPRKFGK